MSQAEMALIPHEVENRIVQQRASDGYINATALCKAAGKQFHGYARTGPTQRFLQALEAETHRSVSELVQSVRGGPPDQQGTWVHPYVAINLAQWLSPQFAVQVSIWVHEWMSGKGAREARIPDHIRRYLVNRPKLLEWPTHFSMLDQMTLRLLAPLEAEGYTLPAKLMPDIALGLMFSKWLRTKGEDPNSFPTYNHEFLDHRPTVKARLYPNRLITAFNRQLDKWLSDGRARKYFGSRDEEAITPLDRVLAALPPASP